MYLVPLMELRMYEGWIGHSSALVLTDPLSDVLYAVSTAPIRDVDRGHNSSSSSLSVHLLTLCIICQDGADVPRELLFETLTFRMDTWLCLYIKGKKWLASENNQSVTYPVMELMFFFPLLSNSIPYGSLIRAWIMWIIDDPLCSRLRRNVVSYTTELQSYNILF